MEANKEDRIEGDRQREREKEREREIDRQSGTERQ